MGQININILKKPNVEAFGKVFAVQVNSLNCFREWSIAAKVSVNGWIEFIVPPRVTMAKISPNEPFETQEPILSGITTWQAIFEPYVSPNASQNTQTTVLTINLYDSQGGTLLDTEVITHFHSQLFC